MPGDEQFNYSSNRELESAAKVRALEALLIEKGIIGSETVNKVLDYFDSKMGPFNGAKLVAKAWVDPDFKQLLVSDCNAACEAMGMTTGMAGAEGEHMRVAENTASVHNLIICTLCSCYPWPTLGLPPYWYKDPTFRARAAREPRKVLKEFGLDLEASVDVRVWDSSGQIRWWVLPEKPPGADHLSEEELAALVTPEAMMGVAKVSAP
ncbi:nitrile hydratase subunit alpha [Nodosilinea sp. E11]|nr:nitrile hydratase subunit alpha [Nodosilinea sp. E11]WOD39626.1 nitrile hydratase subunit alpha [Nodosilinea sp. E11]